MNVYVHTLYAHSVNVYGHKDSENEKTLLRHKAKTFLLHKAPSLLFPLWSCLRCVNEAFAHSVGFCMSAEGKVLFFTGSNSSREKILSCGQIQ